MLAWVEAIVESLGGRLEFENSGAAGTVFSVRPPVA
jgi:C4-dicarboxylate-specific signal transduction histidine kinase